MMIKISYNFRPLEDAMTAIKMMPSDRNNLKKLQLELNKFFKDSVCREVIYTNNTDKLFFGMSVIANINADTAKKILLTDEKVRIQEYYIELDSRLFGVLLDLSARELTAIILHEVGHLVNDSQPVEELRNEIAKHLAQTNSNIMISDSQYYIDLMSFGIKDALRKITTIFNKNLREEYIADEFVVACGYGKDLESALGKIVKSSIALNADVNNKFVVLQYVLRLYKDVKFKRIAALRAFNKAKSVTPSTLEIREINGAIRSLNQIDDASLIKESAFKKLKYNSMRQLEDDMYEYSIRVKNVDEEADTLMLLREINTKIAVIDDYINSERLSDAEKERWFDLMNKYRSLRDYLSKKQTYTSKSYELWVKTPAVNTRHA